MCAREGPDGKNDPQPNDKAQTLSEYNAVTVDRQWARTFAVEI